MTDAIDLMENLKEKTTKKYSVHILFSNGEMKVAHHKVIDVIFNDNILSIFTADGSSYYYRIKHLKSWAIY